MNRLSLQEIQNRNESHSGEILIACKGKVYNVSGSSRWKEGTHMKRHKAGEDLTRALSSAPHGEDVLDKFPVVGELITDPATKGLPGGFLEKILGLHPHPVSVHFPIALILTASLLTVLGWLLKSEFFITAGFTNLIIGTLATPTAIATGWLSFHYDYRHKWSRTFRLKFIISITFLIVALAAILIHSVAPGQISSPDTWQNVYLILMLCLPPMVVVTGYLGGTITFPR